MSGKPIAQRAQEFYNAVFDAELSRLMDIAEGQADPTETERADGITGEDDARQRIEEHGYGLTKEVVYYVTLAGGGPAARLAVWPDEYGGVAEASLQYCDWFERWTDAPHQDPELVKRYAELLAYYDE
jgi:hypothetical protein